MDDLTFQRIGLNNKLRSVDDAVSASTYADDLDDQNTENYTFDGSGNLKSDAQAGTTLTWTPYGKVNQVTRSDGSLVFDYDANQNRIQKDSTFYIRDAEGNVLAIYKEADNGSLRWAEQHLYGSSRSGILETGISWSNTGLPNTPHYIENSILLQGWKRYELSNHLGNVMAVIGDRKIAKDTNSNKEADFYEPAILSANDYFPASQEWGKGPYS